MGHVVIMLLFVVAPVWVYLDATRNRIGKVEPGPGPVKVSASAGLWASATLLLPILFLPLYLACRPALTRRARERPVVTARRGPKTALLLLAAIPMVLVNLSSMQDSRERFRSTDAPRGSAESPRQEGVGESAELR